jgi:hypothetical protein
MTTCVRVDRVDPHHLAFLVHDKRGQHNLSADTQGRAPCPTLQPQPNFGLEMQANRAESKAVSV